MPYAYRTGMGKFKLAFMKRNCKPVIAAGCDPVPFRTRKSNLSSLLCY